MKRSTSITLTIFASATLAACGDDKPPPPPMKPYATVQECVVAGNTEALCKEAFEKAMETHRATAPKFTDEQSCQRGIDVDRCVKTQVRNPDGSFSDVFLPAMAGYILGQALSQPRDDRDRVGYSGGYYGGVPYSTGPVYNSRTYPGGYRDSGNMRTTILNGPGARPSPPSVPSIGGGLPSTKPSLGLPSSRPSNVGTTTISRGGFGGSGGSFSSGG